MKRSRDMLEDHHERGAELADRDTLVARILAKNNRSCSPSPRASIPTC
jgi:hypothetical protein